MDEPRPGIDPPSDSVWPCGQCAGSGRAIEPPSDSENLLPRDWRGEPVDRPLVDDLATVLSQTVVGWNPDLAQAPEVRRVLARYRQETADG